MDDMLAHARACLPRMLRCLQRASAEDTAAIWEEAKHQEHTGWLGPLLSLDELPANSIPVRRFRIHPPGRKPRSCDDCSSGPGGNCFNEYCQPRNKIRLPTDSSICATLRAIALLFGS
eukprot:461039-Karenia_brevis.AAC.1